MGNIGGFVAAEIKIAANLSGMDGVAAAETCHAGSTDQFFLGKPFQYAVDEHGFCFCVVKSFADDVRIGKKGFQIFTGYLYAVCGDVQIRIDLEQLFFQSICFIHAHMAQQILLAIQIGQVYTVKINEV